MLSEKHEKKKKMTGKYNEQNLKNLLDDMTY